MLLLASVFLVAVSVGVSRTVNHCPSGHQLTGHFCGLGGSRCPTDYYCEVAPTDAYAVCCPRATQFNPCPTGAPIHGHNCRMYPCPAYHYCESAPNDAYSVCCPSDCVKGRPMMVNGTQVFCGRGPTRQNCPAHYHCHVSPVDAFAVCCMD